MGRPLRTFAWAGFLSALLALAWARPAAACASDLDCPGATCGSPVCQLSVSGGACVAAGTDVEGFDGACTIDAECKCAGEGATCSAETFHCTFTLPSQAPAQPDGGAAEADAGDGTDNTAGCRIAKGPADSLTIFASGVAALALVRRGRRGLRGDARRSTRPPRRSHR